MRPAVINMAGNNGSTRHVCRVDRSTVWGNPLRIGKNGSRADVLRGHEGLLRDTPEMVMELWRLSGLTLACWCDPSPCHGWLLCFLANCTWEEQFEWLLGAEYWTPQRLRHRSTPSLPGWLQPL